MNGSPHGGPQGGPPGTPENWRGKMDQWRQQALAERRDHEPQARRQVQSQFQQYSPPWYSSMVGFNRDFNLLVAQSRLSGFAATLGRDFSDEEAKAITEYTLAEIHSNAAGKFGIVGLAGYMTYRGRHTWQFPFYRPKLGGRFTPNEATSLFSNKKIRGVYPNLVWHTMRFLAYTLVTTLMVEPVYRTVNHIRTESQMTKDPRLQRFAKDASARVEQILTKGPGQAPVTRREDSEEDSQNDYSFDRQQIEQQPSPDSDNHSPSQGNWYNPTQTMRSRQPTQEQQPQANDDWDVLDDDDASPVASTSRNSPSANVSGGSAWDRLRQQSQPRNRPNFESQSNWENASRSQPQQSQGGWGEPPRSRDSYSYSSSDQDKGSSKDQAQAEFDRLVERERRGVDQENAWSRR